MTLRKRYSKLKKVAVVFLAVMITFWGFVEIVNRNSKNMTGRQKLLKAIYPALMWWTKVSEKNTTKLSNQQKQPPVSFYSLKGTLNNNREIDFDSLKGKKVLLVNTASDCGYTNQYDDLQTLYDEYQDKLIVIGFPSNDFKEQEKGSDEEIAQFCKQNFDVTFPLMKKSIVIKSRQQNSVFKWLTDLTENGWNNEPPSWNFTKYLVDEQGVLTNCFGPSIAPTSKDVIDAINAK